MTLNDPLANVLSAIQNAEQRGKNEITTLNNSDFIRRVLDLLVREGYLQGYEQHEDAKGNSLTITLNGTINKIGVIKPRFQVQRTEFERFEKRFLPAKGFGHLLISTTKGLLTHEEAKQHGVGGTLIAYCY